jgi:hypothetical protein
VALYRFLFAPVLLAVAVFTTSPKRAPQPRTAPQVQAVMGPRTTATRAPAAPSRVAPSRPGSVR